LSILRLPFYYLLIASKKARAIYRSDLGSYAFYYLLIASSTSQQSAADAGGIFLLSLDCFEVEKEEARVCPRCGFLLSLDCFRGIDGTKLVELAELSTIS